MLKPLVITLISSVILSTSALDQQINKDSLHVYSESDLNLEDKNPFNISCDFEVSFSRTDNDETFESHATYTSKGFLIFEHYNTSSAVFDASIDYKGEEIPAPQNRLPRRTLLIHFQHKDTAYPYSDTKISAYKDAGNANPDTSDIDTPLISELVPSAYDTLDDIKIERISQRCPIKLEDVINNSQ
ncbi:hypothetical protein [Parendozoicomonas haliclonae]|uniref:Uncharacterized protein n=1 Tax=Parendozoicomonas haliclonae TaxID=1960125 RepID=A0A1X7APJ1_9GAMM|nr:hypothetical protein [Parendozoicomonas haliclonae]SMA50063.1 hypothetical protein EHSB41UT_03854 [Parendozoicomonas haliclonae]